MFKVTEKAVESINQMLKDDGKDGVNLRVYAASMSCSGIQYGIAYDEEERDDDVKVEAEGLTFVMDEFTKDDLKDAILDYIKTPAGEGLIFSKPNAQEGCSSCAGCA